MDNTESFILPKEEIFMTNLDSSPELAVSPFQQTFLRNKEIRIDEFLLPFSGDGCTSFPYWWWFNTQTLNNLDICPSLQRIFLLKAILEPAQSTLTTITEYSETLRGLWEELNLKFGGSLEVIKSYMKLHVKTGIIPSIKTDPEQALLKLEKHQEIQNGLRDFWRFSKDKVLHKSLY